MQRSIPCPAQGKKTCKNLQLEPQQTIQCAVEYAPKRRFPAARLPRKERLAPRLARKPLVSKADLHGIAGAQNFGTQTGTHEIAGYRGQVTRSGYMVSATWSQCCGAVRCGRMVLEAGGKCGQVCTGCDHEPSRTRLGGKSTKVTKKSTPEPSRAIPSQNQPYSVRVIISLEPRTSVTLGRCRCDRSSSASNGTGGIRNGVFHIA